MHIEDHIPLVRSIVRKAIRLDPSLAYIEEDLVQEGSIALQKAMDKYDPERGAFSTYAYRSITNRVSREVSKHRRLVTSDKQASEIFKDSPYTYSSEVGKDVLDMLDILSYPYKDIVKKVMVDGRPLSSVAATYSVSVSKIKTMIEEAVSLIRSVEVDSTG